MVGEVPFTATQYGEGDGYEAVALVTGFAGKASDLERAALDLVAHGRDVMLYTYDPCVLLAGDAELLPNLIDTLSKDFTRHMYEYDQRRYAGASLGGAIAAGMQKRDANPERGLLAATGIDAAELIMENPVFGAMVGLVHHVNIRRTYQKNGYMLADLKERWRDIQIPPMTPISIALGGLDYVVQRREIMPKIASWKKDNPDIRVIHKPWLGHNGTIRWFNRNITSMIDPEPTTDGTDTDIIDIAQAA